MKYNKFKFGVLGLSATILLAACSPATTNESDDTLKSIESDDMTVRVDPDFPRVIDYTMADEKVMHGQPLSLDTIIINDIDLKPEITSELDGDDKIVYTMEVKDAEENIDAVFTSEFEVIDNTLAFRITEIDNLNEEQSDNENIIRTIEIPNHSLVSVRSDDDNAELMGANMSTNTIESGDTLTNVDDDLTNFDEGYMYAFVSDSDLSAGLSTNSLTSEKGDFNRVTAQATTDEDEGYNSLGLSSSQFIYNRDVKYDEHTLDLPEVKVAITADANGDDQVDWQDGAIAFRDIMYLPEGSEEVKDLVAYRIAMNFGSHAQNPFLMTLDNIKKINAHTDDLGQSLLLKGYGNEGHDSGHLNYKDIGSRMGGVDEFKDLLNQSVDYGARVGIHVNASETYPESPYFEEERLATNPDGSYAYGWNWLDQSILIDADYDLANGRRERFEDLKEVVGDNLDWVYIDVWGQHDNNEAWSSRQIAKEVLDQGWRLGGEWGYSFEADSTFNHNAIDLPYADYENKGINSDVSRFIFNAYRDSWIGDYEEDNGAANYPLLGGYYMKDFEGWQGRNDYDGYIENLFETNLSTKFVQHFDITRWVDGDTITMPHPDGQGEDVEWTPEMLIELEGDLGKLVIERKSNDFENNEEAYRGRTMELDGRLILDDDTYLLPWNWDANGNDLDSADEKLYHFNQQGGETTWTLASDWNVSEVKLYKLTETGRVLVDTVDVKDGEITLDAEKNQAYTVYKEEQEPIEVTYGEGAHIVDPHFNTTNLDAWHVEGDGAQVVKTEDTNDVLEIKDNKSETNVSQVLTDLTPGEDYVAYVGVDNRSDEKAKLTVDFDDFETSEYTEKSIAKNYVQAYGHNTESSTVDGNSYFQNMFVYFTAPEEGTDVTLTLSRDAGEGSSYFDDVRVTENNGNPQIDEGEYFQDFEDSAQGIVPFVVGDVEGVKDNRTHLSEFNEPYTQRGWNDKKISDVIEGNWSLKTNGLTEQDSLVYQTIPQNLRFKPGVKYKVSFDYEAGSEATYAVVLGDGEVTGNEEKQPLAATLHEDGDQTFEIEMTGSDTGQSWFGIWSTDKAADIEGLDEEDLGSFGDEVDFLSYKDVVLDNIRVVEIK